MPKALEQNPRETSPRKKQWPEKNRCVCVWNARKAEKEAKRMNEDFTPANPDAVRDLWLSCAKPALRHGTLEKMPTTIAKTPLEKKQKQEQAYWLSRKSFGAFPAREFERIFGDGRARNEE